MRSIFSFRFLAAIASVFGLLVGLAFLFGLPFGLGGDDAEQASSATVVGSPSGDGPWFEEFDEMSIRQIELVDRVISVDQAEFAVVDHAANQDAVLQLDDDRALTVKAGTPGEDYCGALHQPDSECAVIVDLLGEGAIWFALVPLEPILDEDEMQVRLPAIDVLENRRARLVNGWELPYDEVLVRLCANDDDPDTLDDFQSYREFREVLGDDFTAIFSIRKAGEQSRMSAVQCRVQVPWAQQSIEDAHLRVRY